MSSSDGGAVGFVSLLRRNREIRRLWLAQVVSEFGDWMNLVALFRVLAQLAPGAAAPGWVMVIQMLPWVLVGPIAGSLADRFDRKTILIVADLVRAGVVLGFLAIDDPSEVWLLYLLAGLQFSVAAFFEPARSALVPSLAKGEELLAANALMGVTWSVMLAVGGAAGGLIAGLFSPQVAFWVDSASFLLSAVILVGLRSGPAAGVSERRAGSGSAPFSEVLREVLRRPRLASALAIKAGLAISGGGLWILTVVYGQKLFPLGADGSISVGLFYGAHGAGAVVGALAAAPVFRRGGPWVVKSVLVAFAARGFFWALLGGAASLTVAILAVILISACGSFLWVASVNLLQSLSSSHIQGRLFALDLAIVTLTLSATIRGTSVALDRFGVPVRTAAFATAAGACLVALAWLPIARRWSGWEAGGGASGEGSDSGRS